MPVTFRPGTPGDARGVAEVNVAAWRAAFRGVVPDAVLDGMTVEGREEIFQGALSGRSPAGAHTVVAEDDGRIVGFATWGPSRDDDAGAGTGEVYAVYVLPARWGQGIGRTLLGCAVAALAAQGCSRVALWTLAGIPRTHRFYAAAGFKPDGATKVVERGGAQLDHVRLAAAIAADHSTGTVPCPGTSRNSKASRMTSES